MPLREERPMADSAINGNACPTPCNTTQPFLGLNCSQYLEDAFDRLPETHIELEMLG